MALETLSICFLAGGTKENCAIAVVRWNGWSDWVCDIPDTHLIHCPCEKEGPVYLTMRGRCLDSAIDTYWTPQTAEGRYFLHGIKTSEARFDDLSNTWKLKAYGKKAISQASSDATYHSFLLGKSNWIITNDTSMNKNF